MQSSRVEHSPASQQTEHPLAPSDHPAGSWGGRDLCCPVGSIVCRVQLKGSLSGNFSTESVATSVRDIWDGSHPNLLGIAGPEPAKWQTIYATIHGRPTQVTLLPPVKSELDRPLNGHLPRMIV